MGDAHCEFTKKSTLARTLERTRGVAYMAALQPIHAYTIRADARIGMHTCVSYSTRGLTRVPVNPELKHGNTGYYTHGQVGGVQFINF